MKVTIIAGNGIGGTEKAAFIYASELARRGHQVSAITRSDGPRSATLLDAGVEIHDIGSDSLSLRGHFSQFQPDIVHQHVSGYGDHRALYDAVDGCEGKRPRIIETNVFGQLMDRYDDGHVSFRMFVSFASGCQAFQRRQIKPIPPDPGRYSVLSNPLTPYSHPTASVRKSLRHELGIREDDFLLVRIGRPGGKWTSWDCEAFRLAHRKDLRLKLLLMEPSARLAGEVAAGRWGEGIIIHKASSDFEFISNLYGSADAMIHASDFGESFGYTLAEAMQAGLPIVTMSTPWGDNAQVQLVRNGFNGFVCCSISGMADAILKILRNDKLRLSMSDQAKSHIAEISDLSRDTDLLEEIMVFVTGGSPGPRMQTQFETWMSYRSDVFEAAQIDLDDRDSGFRFARWKLYSKYRQTKTAIRQMIDRNR